MRMTSIGVFLCALVISWSAYAGDMAAVRESAPLKEEDLLALEEASQGAEGLRDRRASGKAPIGLTEQEEAVLAQADAEELRERRAGDETITISVGAAIIIVLLLIILL